VPVGGARRFDDSFGAEQSVARAAARDAVGVQHEAIAAVQAALVAVEPAAVLEERSEPEEKKRSRTA
jgi:hypothetical protein